MYESHYYTIHGICPCGIGAEAVQRAARIYAAAASVAEFVNEMENQRVIGKRIWYDERENTIFIAKVFACDCGGGCAENDTLIGQRCHCDHYNRSTETRPLHYCKCGAEFYRPMFAPLFGDTVCIEPHRTVLAGDEECVLAVRLDRTEGSK